ncbi:hypothetical protein, partial [Bilophila wadsworthia]|uniref:hypothetical protein n=1 Tax=Bilophila wadsworthia TaxID=35833 RepID=UPI003AB62E13
PLCYATRALKRDQCRKEKTAQPPRSLPFGRGISSPHGNGVTGKARHLAVSAVHEKGEPQKGRPIGHKKGIPKDASVLGLIAFEVLRLSKGHLAGNTIFAESALCCGALNMRSASRPFKMGKA